uniref:Uncharacterized protein n=1 Tax=Oryza rufipogon TaxID=4529 RepID=A0A0E0MT72_ORYRU
MRGGPGGGSGEGGRRKRQVPDIFSAGGWENTLHPRAHGCRPCYDQPQARKCATVLSPSPCMRHPMFSRHFHPPVHVHSLYPSRRPNPPDSRSPPSLIPVEEREIENPLPPNGA